MAEKQESIEAERVERHDATVTPSAVNPAALALMTTRAFVSPSLFLLNAPLDLFLQPGNGTKRAPEPTIIGVPGDATISLFAEQAADYPLFGIPRPGTLGIRGLAFTTISGHQGVTISVTLYLYISATDFASNRSFGPGGSIPMNLLASAQGLVMIGSETEYLIAANQSATEGVVSSENAYLLVIARVNRSPQVDVMLTNTVVQATLYMI